MASNRKRSNADYHAAAKKRARRPPILPRDDDGVRMLLESGADPQRSLEYACETGRPDVAERLIRIVDCDWPASLACACAAGQESVVDAVLKAGRIDFLRDPDMYLASPDYGGWMPGTYIGCAWNEKLQAGMIAARISGHLSIIERLIVDDADAGDFLALPRDANLVFELLTTTSLRPSELYAIDGIATVVARLDAFLAEARAVLNVRCLMIPDLQDLVAGYCGNRDQHVK